ncbi:MAG: hypothetical protein KDE31_01980 [Caldilineaceae bacterium]|nr:hypothetical protein [Caldilineaceae bacterium]
MRIAIMIFPTDFAAPAGRTLFALMIQVKPLPLAKLFQCRFYNRFQKAADELAEFVGR